MAHTDPDVAAFRLGQAWSSRRIDADALIGLLLEERRLPVLLALSHALDGGAIHLTRTPRAWEALLGAVVGGSPAERRIAAARGLRPADAGFAPLPLPWRKAVGTVLRSERDPRVIIAIADVVSFSVSLARDDSSLPVVRALAAAARQVPGGGARQRVLSPVATYVAAVRGARGLYELWEDADNVESREDLAAAIVGTSGSAPGFVSRPETRPEPKRFLRVYQGTASPTLRTGLLALADTRFDLLADSPAARALVQALIQVEKDASITRRLQSLAHALAASTDAAKSWQEAFPQGGG